MISFQPHCRSCSYISFVLLPCVFLVLPSWTPWTAGVPGLYVSIELFQHIWWSFIGTSICRSGWGLSWQACIGLWGSCRSMHQSTIGICRRMDIYILIFLLFSIIMTQFCNYGADITFNLSIYLRTIGCCLNFSAPGGRQRDVDNWTCSQIEAHCRSVRIDLSCMIWAECSKLFVAACV